MKSATIAHDLTKELCHTAEHDLRVTFNVLLVLRRLSESRKPTLLLAQKPSSPTTRNAGFSHMKGKEIENTLISFLVNGDSIKDFFSSNIKMLEMSRQNVIT